MTDLNINLNEQSNILYVSLSGTPSMQDIERYIDQERTILESLTSKVWYVSDISGLGPIGYDMIKHYLNVSKNYKDKYVFDYCIICAQIFQKFTSMFYNLLKGESHPIFYTIMEAYGWVAKEQLKHGKHHPVDAEMIAR
jgi:hypothetical protein